MSSSIESAILERVILPTNGSLPPDLARYILKLDFPPSDHQRVEELSAKAQEGTLSDDERAELEGYLHINDLLMIMQSKARTSLRQSSSHDE